MEKEKLFNLQLTIQKLEEELSYYRNGTSLGDLLDVVREKDAELESLRTKLAEKDDVLRKIGKRSAEVLSTYDALANEKAELQSENSNLRFRLSQIEEQFEAAATQSINTINSHEQIIRKLTETVEEYKRQNTDLQNSLINKNVLNDQLKIRISAFEQDSATSKINEEQVFNLRKSITDKDHAIKSLKEHLADSDRSIEKLQKRCADLVAEKGDKFKQLDLERQEMINQVQKFRESMTANISQRDDALKRKDDKIKELTFQVNLLTQEVKMKSQRLEEGLAERNSFWQCKVTDLEIKLQEMCRVSPEARNEMMSNFNQENKSSKGRSVVERKVLKERTNSSDIYFDASELTKPSNATVAASIAPTARMTRSAVFSVFPDKMN